MKTEVLQSIKKTEEEYKSMISAAEEEKKRSIASAEEEANRLVQKAELDSGEYRKVRLAEARTIAAQKNEETLKQGEQGTAAMRSAASGNLTKAVELLVERFKGQMNV